MISFAGSAMTLKLLGSRTAVRGDRSLTLRSPPSHPPFGLAKCRLAEAGRFAIRVLSLGESLARAAIRGDLRLPTGEGSRFVIVVLPRCRGRDHAYQHARRVRPHSPARSPWQHAYVECVIGSIRREVLSRFAGAAQPLPALAAVRAPCDVCHTRSRAFATNCHSCRIHVSWPHGTLTPAEE